MNQKRRRRKSRNDSKEGMVSSAAFVLVTAGLGVYLYFGLGPEMLLYGAFTVFLVTLFAFFGT